MADKQKRSEQLKSIREKSVEDLQTLQNELGHELLNLRFRNQSGRLTQSAQLQSVRRRIARVQTVLKEKQVAAAAS